MCVCPVISDSVTPWTVALQAPLSMEFPRQEHWSGLPFPSPGDLPDSGIEPRSPTLQMDFLSLSHWGSPLSILVTALGDWGQSLGLKDPPKEEMATHSSILAWEIPWTGKPGGLQSMGLQRVGHD